MSSLGIFGASGKMGKAIKTLATGMEEICSINEYARGDDINSFIEKSEFIVDFSSSNATEFLINSLLHGEPKPVLIGTTSLSKECLKAIELLAKKMPVMHAPNVSIGANLQAAIVEKMATILNSGYDVEIVDIHHKLKKDAPSGTALMLACNINKGFEMAGVVKHNIVTDRANKPIRSKNEISISSIRAGNITGEHIVRFYGEYDSLSITHKVEKRELLALGAIKAIVWLKNMHPGKYNMREMLGI